MHLRALNVKLPIEKHLLFDFAASAPVAAMYSLKLLAGLKTSFLDQSEDSEESCRAQLLVNESLAGSCVLNAIEEELRSCSSFCITVAFVTMSGLTPLLQTLSELKQRGIPGRFLTTDYLTFTEPKALEKLREFDNIEVRMFCTSKADASAQGFHTKGYIFQNGTQSRFIIGSSNLTGAALKTNHEWNVKLIAAEKGEMAQCVRAEFENLWSSPLTLPIRDAIEDYQQAYARQKQLRHDLAADVAPIADSQRITPNGMQKSLMAKIISLMQMPENVGLDRRGLLISATGTGKTFASAFAVKSLNPSRVLFLVHREQIARKSCDSYKRVLGRDMRYGFLISQDKSALQLRSGKAVVFSTMQTMVKNLSPSVFAANSFDVIVIDEVHRAGAQSYKQIMSYYKPRLWLGMTATPDRPDDENIYAMFNHQILLDLRLQQALEQNLLCPFHYFGITEFVDDNLKPGDLADFSKLTSDARVRHILRQVKLFGYSGTRVKGLMFCSTNKEAQELSRKFNAAGLRTLALSGEDPQQTREEAISKLTADSGDELDYILTVDIFNEGVDIPEVNQVVLLRQTQSPIVFIQQLGRGLRKSPGKEYLVVIDFIGNYDNNYMIPVALSGDRSYQKDSMRKTLIANTIPGNSTIHFDVIARERIFKAIDAARTNSMAELRNAYRLLKYQLGRVPSLRDFDEHGSIDAVKFFSAKPRSYAQFLLSLPNKDSSEENPAISDAGLEILAYLSSKIGSAQRISEAIVLQEILNGRRDLDLKQFLCARLQAAGISFDKAHLVNCRNVLTNNFARNVNEKVKTPNCVFIAIDADETWRAHPVFASLIDAQPDLRHHLADLIAFIFDRYQKRFSKSYRDTAFTLYERYTYDDVCRLLNWEQNMPATNIGGYRYDKNTRTLPVFINYDKSEDAIQYHDHFESQQSLIALSKTNRRTDSTDADHIYKRCEEDKQNRIFLFVRKNKDDNETKAFYFLGEVCAEGAPEPIVLEEKTPAFEIRYRLSEPVRKDIYTYLTN